MDILEAIKSRHSVRSYKDQNIEGEALDQLKKTIDDCNRDSGLNIQLCLNDPKAFSGFMAKYGKFKNVKNYIALVGKKGDKFEEKSGYYGEKIVLRAQQLGLNTCWVGGTYSKGESIAKINSGEKLLLVIAIGYGETNGVSHKNKPIAELCSVNDNIPDWFKKGIEAVQHAPTALNQQKFRFELNGTLVKAVAGLGFFTKVDLGIAKYHFEIGAEKNGWEWAET